jgi:hypothetical protein
LATNTVNINTYKQGKTDKTKTLDKHSLLDAGQRAKNKKKIKIRTRASNPEAADPDAFIDSRMRTNRVCEGVFSASGICSLFSALLPAGYILYIAAI